MEEKTDKVVGYIEYLGAGGMIGEIVPYTSVEKFKDEILDWTASQAASPSSYIKRPISK